MNTRSRLAIFDLDGTLFDTKDVNYQAYRTAIERCGFNTDIDYGFYCDFCNGNNYKTFLPKLIENIDKESMEKIHSEKMSLYQKYLPFARKNNTLFSLIEALRDNYVIALVTTASKQNTMDILNDFSVAGMFDYILTKEDVINTKPDPECFVKIMNLTGISPEFTVIFEDSETGLKAAKASGADYVRVFGYN